MPAPLSSDISNRFQVLHLEGHSAREIGRRLLISAATAVRFAACLRQTGNLTPAANSRRQGHGRLVPYEGFFAELVEQDPDITLKELQAALLEAHGVQASLSGIDVVLRRLDLTYKKSLIADERRKPHVKKARHHWLRWTLPAIAQAPHRVVFIDETSVKTNMTRLRGRSKCGTRLNASAPFGAWGTQTFIAGLTHDQLIAPWVIKGAMDGAAFAAYVREVLVPEIEPGTVVICDNLATHKNVEAAAALRAHECWFLYLPPYSPDLNPIEQAFSKLKAHLRKLGARTFTDLFEALGGICDLFTPDECWNFLANAGYAST